jgi:hypothetical protein
MKSVLFDFKTSKEAWFETASQLYLKKINGFGILKSQLLKL